jgi:hypothetical protein
MDEPTDDDFRAWADIEIPRMSLSYYLDPRNWSGEASCYFAQHGWTKHCHVHDRIHWAWTHRNCCRNQRTYALRALRKNGYLR